MTARPDGVDGLEHLGAVSRRLTLCADDQLEAALPGLLADLAAVLGASRLSLASGRPFEGLGRRPRSAVAWTWPLGRRSLDAPDLLDVVPDGALGAHAAVMPVGRVLPAADLSREWAGAGSSWLGVVTVGRPHGESAVLVAEWPREPPPDCPLLLAGIIATGAADRHRLWADHRRDALRVRRFADLSNDLIMVVDGSEIIEYVSPVCRAMLSYEPEELIGRPLDLILPIEDLIRTTNQWDRDGTRGRLVHRFVHRDGRIGWAESQIVRELDPVTGQRLRTFGCLRDITDRVALEHQSERREALERIVLDVAERLLAGGLPPIDDAVGWGLVQLGRHFGATRAALWELEPRAGVLRRRLIWSVDPDRAVRGSYTQAEAPRLFSILSRGETVYTPSIDVYGDDWGTERSAFERSGVAAQVVAPLWVQSELLGALSVDVSSPGDPGRGISDADLPMLDLLARLVGGAMVLERTQQRLGRLASQDPLTGLPNRRHLFEALEGALTHAGPDHQIGVLYLDLDGFKEVNDTAGHAEGDLLLIAVADRLLRAMRPADTVARIGGDEFVVLLDGVAGPEDAVAVAARLVRELREPVSTSNSAWSIGVSVGLVVYAGGSASGGDLIRRADHLMYQAKRDGRNRFVLGSVVEVAAP